MELDDVRDMISESLVGDWNVMDYGPIHWEAEWVYRIGEDSNGMLSCYPRMRATYRPNIAIGISFGFEFSEDVEPAESANYPLFQMYGGYVDITYNGVPIERCAYAAIEDDQGNRILLPDPHVVRSEHGAKWYVISRFEENLFTLVNRMDGLDSINRHLYSARISTEDLSLFPELETPGLASGWL